MAKKAYVGVAESFTYQKYTANTETVYTANQALALTDVGVDDVTVYYSDSYEMVGDTLSLVNPVSDYFSGQSVGDAEILTGKYFTVSGETTGSEIWYCDSVDAEWGYGPSVPGLGAGIYSSAVASAYRVAIEETDVKVRGTYVGTITWGDCATYPEDGVHTDGYWYVLAAGGSASQGVARTVKRIYEGVSGVAREVKKAHVGVSGVAREFFVSPPRVGTVWTITSNGNWVVPVTGKYNLELHGGGGGGGGSRYRVQGLSMGSTDYSGGGGGGSGELYENVTLTGGTSMSVTIGAAGRRGAKAGDGGDGGDTTFGSYTVAGGKGGEAYAGAGAASGSLATAGGAGVSDKGSTGDATVLAGGAGGQGNKNNISQTYGDGGNGGNLNGNTQNYGSAGKPGAVIITYMGS